jgi:hypothetical protein
MENKISFQDLLQKIRELPKDSGMGYIGEFPVKVSLSVWLETDEDGKISHFTPHLNFYQSENDDNEPTHVYAQLETRELGTEALEVEDVIEFLETFVRQAGIDTTIPSLEEDEAYG